MKKLSLLLLLLLVASTGAQAQKIIQSLERNVPGQGKVTIHQEPRVETLLGTAHAESDGEKTIRAAGFRIQAYAGNNTRVAKNEAFQVAARIKEAFPELPIYTSFIPPRWLCRVGDFRSIEEADAIMRKLKATGMFREVAIVKEQINISL
ncbi:MAG: SPOR domain-containing protein [Bacteroides sp.]